MTLPNRHDPGIVWAATVGAGAGVIGTVAMSLIMLPAKWLGWLGTQPPRRVADVLIDEAKIPASEGQRRFLTAVVHLAIGAVAGAALAIVRVVRRGPRLSRAVGGGLGVALWAVNYIGVAPAAGLLPRSDHDRPGRPPVMLAANALYGMVTAAIIEATLPVREGPRSLPPDGLGGMD